MWPPTRAHTLHVSPDTHQAPMTDDHADCTKARGQQRHDHRDVVLSTAGTGSSRCVGRDSDNRAPQWCRLSLPNKEKRHSSSPRVSPDRPRAPLSSSATFFFSSFFSLFLLFISLPPKKTHPVAFYLFSHGRRRARQPATFLANAARFFFFFHYLVTVTFEWSFAHDRHL